MGWASSHERGAPLVHSTGPTGVLPPPRISKFSQIEQVSSVARTVLYRPETLSSQKTDHRFPLILAAGFVVFMARLGSFLLER